MSRAQSRVNQERDVRVQNGWVMLVLILGALVADIVLLILTDPPLKPIFAILLPFFVLLMFGFFTLQPNQARVLILFGAYKGTVRDSGFHWGNPFYSNGPSQLGALARTIEARKRGGPEHPAHDMGGSRRLSHFKLSLRTRNFNSDKLKVNAKRGNPIEIGAVVVWRVQDTAQAVFDVDDYE